MNKLVGSISNYMENLGSGRTVFFFVIIICLAYINSLGVYFIWDDYSAVVSNMHTRELKLSDMFAPMYREVSSGKFRVPIYSRPVQILTYAIDYRLWRLNPFGYHLTSMILHILNAILVFSLLRGLLKNKLPAFLGALLFGTNPVFASSVTYISGRADVLLLFFSLLMLACFIKSIKTERLILPYYFLSLLCFIFVLGSKEIGLISILFLLAADKLIYRYSVTAAKSLIYLPHASIFFAWQLIKPASLPGFASNTEALKNAPFAFFSALKGIYAYFALSILPYHLRMGRSISSVFGTEDKWFYITTLLLLVSTVFIARARKNKLLLFGLIWFSAPLFLQLFFNYAFSRSGNEMLLPEHNLYFCYFGFLIIIFSLLSQPRVLRLVRAYLVPVFLIIVLHYAALTVTENVKWGDEIKFFNTMLKYNRDSKFNYVAYSNLGYAYEREENFEQAERNHRLAAETPGTDPHFYYSLANFYIRRDELDKATESLLSCVQLDRSFFQAYFLLGEIYAHKGMTGEAKKNFQTFILFDPANKYALRYLELLDGK